ncbi:CCA tRNA nucleotidyltransferase [Sneathiella sp. CAU 1612]|uniref:CCA tRNA nucleotidyltransferase n=1 Tax=Sneathiella sedimenti TaxID=2816034 RepID=A0ABS3FA16_9PROT|nr:CCA tRNA nucleotidyltransferase [Sneathiella sedimenti]MBO0335293.1 CCA tRNA nucleotidyltransferase [Sneathiella sedimenti]
MPSKANLVDIFSNPPPWRKWPETQAVLDALINEGGAVRFVGGCVRDALLGLATDDIDIATDLLPGTVIQGLERAGITALPTGLDHGTITAVLNKRHFEITTLRVDVVSHGRHAEIAFTQHWERDAERRDFTFNALYLDPAGELVDPVGGLADLAVRHVRFIGNAEDRIREDRLRVLRYFRFYARFGANNPDEHAVRACAKAARQLGQLSVERVQKELFLLLDSENPGPALELMDDTGVLAAIIDGPADKGRLKSLLSLDVPSDGLLRFAALLGGDKERALHLATKLRFSNKQKDRLAVMCAGDVVADMPASTRKEALYKIGKAGFLEQTLLLWASLGPNHKLDAYLEEASCWTAPEFPVTGQDLLSRGIGEGEKLGRMLKEMESRWIASGFRRTKAELLSDFLPDA